MKPLLLAPALALLAALVTAAAPARAEPTAADKVLSEQVKAQGDTLMHERRYTEALEAYERAASLFPDPRLHYNRGSASLALDRNPEALRHLQKFKAEAPESLQAQVPDLDGLIESVRLKITTLTLGSQTKGARVLLRGQVIGVTPLPRPIRTNAGRAKLELLAEGYEPYVTELDLRGGEATTLQVRLTPKAGATVLVVRSPVSGARVTLDGKALGTVPAEAMVAPGPHRVLLTHPDFEERSVSVLVEKGARKTLDLRLEEKTPLHAKWWFWTGVGVLAAGAVATVVLYNTERSPDSGDIEPGTLSTPLRF